MKKKGPFDAAIRRISALVNDHGDGTDGWLWDQVRPVLEAAGKVDKEGAIALVNAIGWPKEFDYMQESRDQIRAYLEALPDTESAPMTDGATFMGMDKAVELAGETIDRLKKKED